jgi:hypothetical protein
MKARKDHHGRVYLREAVGLSECKVYKANPDGSKGELLRVENPQPYRADMKFGRQQKAG